MRRALVRRALVIAALAMLTLGSSGCSTRCSEAIDRMVDAASDCQLNSPIEDIGGGTLECSDDDAAELERQADCVEAADCSALNGADTAGHKALSECVAGLSQAEE